MRMFGAVRTVVSNKLCFGMKGPFLCGILHWKKQDFIRCHLIKKLFKCNPRMWLHATQTHQRRLYWNPGDTQLNSEHRNYLVMLRYKSRCETRIIAINQPSVTDMHVYCMFVICACQVQRPLQHLIHIHVHLKVRRPFVFFVKSYTSISGIFSTSSSLNSENAWPAYKSPHSTIRWKLK